MIPNLSPSIPNPYGNYATNSTSATYYTASNWLTQGSYATQTVGFDSIDITFQGHTTRIPVMQQIQAAPVPPPAPDVTTFNKYVNASDLMEEFIKFLGAEGVRQGEVMGLPVELFIKWLIIRACEQDGEVPNVTLALPAPAHQPRCLGCQRYLKAGAPVPIHNQQCADRYFARANHQTSAAQAGTPTHPRIRGHQ